MVSWVVRDLEMLTNRFPIWRTSWFYTICSQYDFLEGKCVFWKHLFKEVRLVSLFCICWYCGYIRYQLPHNYYQNVEAWSTCITSHVLWSGVGTCTVEFSASGTLTHQVVSKVTQGRHWGCSFIWGSTRQIFASKLTWCW